MDLAIIILGHILHVVQLHLVIGRPRGSRDLISVRILGTGSLRGGLENSDLFGSLPTTLLLTRILESVIFFLNAVIGLLGNIVLRRVSCSMLGQCV